MFSCLWQCFWCLFSSLASLLLKKYHGGHVVIRFALAGHKQANRPFYRIVAAYNKRARDGKYIEQLGSYDPLPNIYNEKLVSFNFDRIKYWIGCGAHPTKPVAKLLGVYLLHKRVLLKSSSLGNFIVILFLRTGLRLIFFCRHLNLLDNIYLAFYYFFFTRFCNL